MTVYSTLSGRTIDVIKDNLKSTLKELEVLEGITQIINKEHRGRITPDDQGDLANLEVWTSNNLTFIENMNKNILSRTGGSGLTDREILEEIVDILYAFSRTKDTALGKETLHKCITELRADMKGESV